MLGVLYLILACFMGYNLLKKAIPGIFHISETRSFFGKPVKLDNRMVTFPASFLVGTLIMTWVTYMLSYAFHSTQKPMLYGNILSLLELFHVPLVLYQKRNHTCRFVGIQ